MADFPNDFSRDRPPAELMTEFVRNTRLKELFSCDKKLGSLEIDVLNGIFHYGNIYHSVTELKQYSIHTSTPKFNGAVWRRDVEVEIYFTYLLRNGIRHTIKIDKATSEYRNSGRYVRVEPPLKLFGYRQQFSEIIEDAAGRIKLTVKPVEEMINFNDEKGEQA